MPILLDESRSSSDESVKFVWQMTDDATIVESVSLRFPKFQAFCVSTQAGCGLQCQFCATGLEGLTRNLSDFEIAGQVHGMMRHLQERPARVIVSFMGMGEPLQNLTHVLSAAEQIESTYGSIEFDLATVGLVPQIFDLARLRPDFLLQLSLHAPNDALRSKLMPINNRYPIQQVLSAVRHYASVTSKKVFINYLLFAGVNDDDKCAHELATLIGDLPAELKLSEYNYVSQFPLRPSSDERVERFRNVCLSRGLNVREFVSFGTDVQGGCGQLRSRHRLEI